MPTLLEVNSVIPQKWMSSTQKKAAEKMTGIDFIIEYIKDRSWIDSFTPPKIKLKNIGNRVLVLRSGTGSGKSTILPPQLNSTFNKHVLTTQPTRATTQDIPYQIVNFNPHLKLGVNIGFQTGSVSWKPKQKGILFATYGILLQYMKVMNEKSFMLKFPFIIIDEIHVRTLEIDNCLFCLKEILKRNWDKPECPYVILTSATFDPAFFMNYFGCSDDCFIDVQGMNFPIKEHFTEFNPTNYTTLTLDTVEKIHLENLKDIDEKAPIRDILVFVQGQKQINWLVNEIHKLNTMVFSKGVSFAQAHLKERWAKYGGSEVTHYLCPIAVNSANIQRGGAEYKQIFSDINNILVEIYEFDDEGNPGKVIEMVPVSRRVLIGTNAIETGITIDTLKYCVDTGYVKQSLFNPVLGCQLLIDQNITKSSVKQRKGRVGRKGEGEFYAIYTKETYELLNEIPYPDIIKEDATNFLLNVIIQETQTTLDVVESSDRSDAFQMNQFDQLWYKLNSKKNFIAESLDFIQYPSADTISYSLQKLHGLGFIGTDYTPTLFGFYANKFRKISFENIRMILAGYHTGANVLDLITISAFLEVGYDLGIKRYKYKPMNVLDLSEAELDYYYNTLIADEFIEFLFIWHEFCKVVDKLGLKIEKSVKSNMKRTLSIKVLEMWCEEHNLRLYGMFKVVERRDEIISDMMAIGLNPYYNSLDLPKGSYDLVNILKRNRSEGIGEIKKIKESIIEGYRYNLCVFDEEKRKYVMWCYKTVVNLQSKIIKARPKAFVISNVVCQLSFINEGMYDFNAGPISVLDNYIQIDKWL
jgi:HrpA-like RNA helicase